MQFRKFEFFLKKKLFRKRLDVVLSFLFHKCSREMLVLLISNGFCQINLYVIKDAHYIVSGISVLSVYVFFLKKVNWISQQVGLIILYEDRSIIVVKKHFNISTHPAIKVFTNTLVNALLNYIPTLISLPRAGIVHRLDLLASGLLIVAKNLFSYYSLSFQFRNRIVLKFYNAFVSGELSFSGMIKKQCNSLYFLKYTGFAITHVRIQKTYINYTHVRLYPETGRLHQLRKHLSFLNHPILGDFLYGFRIISSKYVITELITFYNNFDKIALHATSILILHPFVRRYVFFMLPMSKEFLNLLRNV